ncbi:hypothetical protein BGZ60DRAFT_422391 [Tricladium varicosporioides]|nr:hypothetical protein BGZ60DRAFT_422391 [Hymenoscyphus varicosporioides]
MAESVLSPDIPGREGETRVHLPSNLTPSMPQVLPGFDEFISAYTWGTGNDFETLSCSEKSLMPDLWIGEGSGQLFSPFSVKAEQFKLRCGQIGFSQEILQKLLSKAPMFEYNFVFASLPITDPNYSSSSKIPTHLEIAVATFENDSFFALLRYDIKSRHTNGVVFIKSMDYLKKDEVFAMDLKKWIDRRKCFVRRHPLMILSLIFSFIQYRANCYPQWRLRLYNLESRLGITRDGERLKAGGYQPIDYDFTLLNADLAAVAKKVADSELSASTLLEHAKAFDRLVGLCEDFEGSYTVGVIPSISNFSEQREELHATIVRSELQLKHLRMAASVLQSHEAVLYNRISKHDTDSMKTIAVVTLVFLPATFVSAIFSTGIFNFHAGDPPNEPRVISKYGWIYLLICLLATKMTLLSWVCWYRWGRVWLEKLKLSDVHTYRRRDTLLPRNGKTEKFSRNIKGSLLRFRPFSKVTAEEKLPTTAEPGPSSEGYKGFVSVGLRSPGVPGTQQYYKNAPMPQTIQQYFEAELS